MNITLPVTDGPLAVLRYVDADFDVVRPGTHVLCAVTGVRIALGELRYWSVDRQEAYADALAANQAYARALENGEAF